MDSSGSEWNSVIVRCKSVLLVSGNALYILKDRAASGLAQEAHVNFVYCAIRNIEQFKF